MAKQPDKTPMTLIACKMLSWPYGTIKSQQMKVQIVISSLFRGCPVLRGFTKKSTKVKSLRRKSDFTLTLCKTERLKNSFIFSHVYKMQKIFLILSFVIISICKYPVIQPMVAMVVNKVSLSPLSLSPYTECAGKPTPFSTPTRPRSPRKRTASNQPRTRLPLKN